MQTQTGWLHIKSGAWLCCGLDGVLAKIGQSNGWRVWCMMAEDNIE